MAESDRIKKRLRNKNGCCRFAAAIFVHKNIHKILKYTQERYDKIEIKNEYMRKGKDYGTCHRTSGKTF